jgi:hypothetical protein
MVVECLIIIAIVAAFIVFSILAYCFNNSINTQKCNDALAIVFDWTFDFFKQIWDWLPEKLRWALVALAIFAIFAFVLYAFYKIYSKKSN